MARKLRLQYPGAIYHAMNRGDRREPICWNRLRLHWCTGFWGCELMRKAFIRWGMEAVRNRSGISLLTTVHLICASLALMWLGACGQDFGGSTRQRHAEEHRRFASLFKAGDTNAPLLAMDWFSDHGVYFCRVDQAGDVFSARDVGHAIQGSSAISARFSLGGTNRPLVETAINALPASSGKALPRKRQILVSGIRSNQWFERVYDRANIPKEVESLYDLTGAYLGWFIPKVEGHEIARLHDANFQGGFATVARNADLAVSFGQWVTNGAYYYPPVTEFWKLERGLRQAAPQFKGISKVPSQWEGVAASPDGSVVAVAIAYGLYVIDAKSGKLLWQAGPLDHDSYFGTTLAIADNGRALYTSGAHIIERWDLLSGRKLATLCTNVFIVKFLNASQDGSMVLAGFGGLNAAPTSFALWELGSNQPALSFSTPDGASVGISPDGQTLVLCHWPGKTLEIWNWKKGERLQVPLRVPYSSGSAYSMHWSPEGKRLAAYVDTYPASVVIYETSSWKPLAQWACGHIGSHCEFFVKQDGRLLQIIGGQIYSLDLTAIKSVAD